MPRSEVRTVRSSGGLDYRLYVAWPSQPPPPSGYPLVLMLDANAAFATAVEAIRMRSPRADATGVVPAVVAGVGYPLDAPYERERRTYDYTATAAEAAGEGRAGAPAAGGAAGFLAFLESELLPLIHERLAIDPARQTLFGHSLGGLFVVHALLARPQAFQSFIAASPSLWWNRAVVDDAIEARLACAATPRAQRVLITVGEYEQALAPWQLGQAQAAAIAARRQERRMVDDARMLAARLAPLAAVVRFELYEGEDHASVVLRSIGSGLRFCLADETVA